VQAIIYKNENGGVCIVYPTEEALKNYTIDEIAKKDVPAGTPYKIVNAADIPTDREFRNAWEVEITDPDGVGIGADAWFAEQEALNDNN
jgi:hypothetical protein